MRIDQKAKRYRDEALKEGKEPIPKVLQGVTKERIRTVLRVLDLESDDIVDAVFALLDNVTPNWFTTAPEGAVFADGATTAHLGTHIGVIQRGKQKLDREGRDYWIKPLREIGAIELRYLSPETHEFVAGHPVAKSNNNCYQLSAEFIDILCMPEEDFEDAARAWIQADPVRKRLRVQGDAAQAARALEGTKHSDLITACLQHYVPNFLKGFEPIFTDLADGVRVTSEDSERLAAAGLTLGLEDPMPDILLWSPETDALWVVEAVTSDGEVDQHKVEQITAWANRHGKTQVGFTTAYLSWRNAAARQAKHKNLAPGTYVWMLDDASKHYLAETFAE